MLTTLEFWNADVLRHMFVVGLPLAEKILRPILVYVSLILLLRIFGKRELINLNPFDFIVLLTLSNTVQNAIIGEDSSLSGGLIGAITLLATNFVVVRFLFRHRRLDQLIEGSPSTLIEDGKVCQKRLAAEMLSINELKTLIHRQGFCSIHEVKKCVLEPGGNVFIEGFKPTDEDRRHEELLKRLDELTKKLEAVIGNAARQTTEG